MHSLDAVTARLRAATDDEKFRLANQREEMQTEESPKQSSKGSTHHSDVKEICEYLKKHTNELVDLIKDPM